jgi:hypothetical protein
MQELNTHTHTHNVLSRTSGLELQNEFFGCRRNERTNERATRVTIVRNEAQNNR